MGELAALDRSAVIARFGAEGAELHDLVRGLDRRPLKPRRPVERLRAEAELEPPVETLEPLRFVLHHLCATLCEQLAARGAGAARATLTLSLEHRGPGPALVAYHQALPEPAAAAGLLERLLMARLEAAPPAAAVERLALELDGTAPEAGQQLTLFERQLAQAARLEWQLASLAIRFGEDRILRASGGDPEARLAEERFSWQAAVRLPPRRRDPAAGPASGHRGGGGRPAAGPRGCAGRACASPWRPATTGASRRTWWRRPLVRDYFKVVGPRLLALVYRDGLDGSWHLERLYD